jgi:hypothetical protein
MPEIVCNTSDPASAAVSLGNEAGVDLDALSLAGVVLVVTAMPLVFGL